MPDVDLTKVIVEIYQRLTKIETKIDDYNGLREKLDNTSRCTDRNTEVIDALIESNKWVRRMAITALITTSCTIIGALILSAIKGLI